MDKNPRFQVRFYEDRNHWAVLDVENLVFSGGEVQTRLTGSHWEVAKIQVTARIQSSDDFLTLLHLFDILPTMNPGKVPVDLIIPYFPYARQDRRMVDREAFSLRVATRLINDLKADQVIICDPHSEVAPALLERCRVFSQLDVIKQCDFFNLALRLPPNKTVLVAPDAGAAKKTAKVAEFYGLEHVVAFKDRNPITGTITKVELSKPDAVAGREVAMIDDICDGGRTFIELGHGLRKAGATNVGLYVTHGIFSRGLDTFKGVIDAVYTTDTFHNGILSKSFPFYTKQLDFDMDGNLCTA